MYFILKISFIILLILSYNQFRIQSIYIGVEESHHSYDDYSDSNESINEQIIHMNDSNVLLEDEFDQTSDVCSLESFIANANHYLPNDYEENVKLAVQKNVKHVNETLHLFKRMSEYMKNITKKLEPLQSQVASRVMEAVYSLDVTHDCLTSILTIVKGMSEGQLWAIKFIDSWGGIPSGLTEGTLTSFGEFDQCLETKTPKVLSGPSIHGQYCLARIVVPYPKAMKSGDHFDPYLDLLVEEDSKTPIYKETAHPLFRKLPKSITTMMVDGLNLEKGALFKFGICIPSTCSPLDLENSINKAINPITRFPLELENHCITKDKPIEINTKQMIGIAFFTFIALCVLFSTLYDLYISKREKSGEECKPTTKSDLYLSFSIIRSTKTLFEASPSLSCLDGIRCFFMLWIVFIHTYVYLIINITSINRVLNSVLFHFLTDVRYILHRNLFIIDTFFLISGTLLSYVMISKLKTSGGRFQYLQYLMFRWLRLIPPVIASIFAIWLFPLIASGPIAKEVYLLFSDGCDDGWYKTVFMFHNYLATYPTPLLCNPPTWSLAVDFHFYAIAPIIFLKMYSQPKMGFIYGVIGIIVGSICNLATKLYGVYHYYEFRNFESAQDFSLSLRHHFYSTHSHIPSFMFGLLLGYVLRYKPNIYLGGKIGETFCWTISISLSIYAMFWSGDWFRETPNPINLWFFMAFGKIFWCTGWAWIIFACSTGRANGLNNFLGAKCFRPWTRLAFGVCLYHSIPIMYRYSSNRQLLIVNDYSVFSGLCFDYLISFFLAYLSYVMTEVPTGNLMQIILVPKPKNEVKKSIDTKNGVVVNLEKYITRL